MVGKPRSAFCRRCLLFEVILNATALFNHSNINRRALSIALFGYSLSRLTCTAFIIQSNHGDQLGTYGFYRLVGRCLDLTSPACQGTRGIKIGIEQSRTRRALCA